jgi:hypothetical protein
MTTRTTITAVTYMLLCTVVVSSFGCLRHGLGVGHCYNAYDESMEVDKAETALVKTVAGNIITVDDVDLLQKQFRGYKQIRLLPGTHTLGVGKDMKFPSRVHGAIWEVKGPLLITFLAEAGKEYKVGWEYSLDTQIITVFVDEEETKKRVAEKERQLGG